MGKNTARQTNKNTDRQKLKDKKANQKHKQTKIELLTNCAET